MPALYIDAQGACLRRRDGEFIVSHRGAESAYPQGQVERVLLLGNVQVSTQALATLMQQNTPVVFLSTRGRLRGRLARPTHANVRLRMRQYDTARDEPRSLALARMFVLGKVRNGKEALARAMDRQGMAAGEFRDGMRRWMDAAMRATTLERLRGIEGMAARDHFAVFSRLLEGTPFPWRGRNRRPPRDPANAMLSLGYTLLLAECESALESVGCDVYAGLLHGGTEQAEYGKPALALDLMEEFRWLVDRMSLRLLRDAKPAQFERAPNGGCFLKPEMRRRFFGEWENLMVSRVRYDHRRLGYREIIGEQAALLARALMDEEAAYRPFMP